jgi:NAD(P)H dehydrogenase (quinone)
MTRVLVLYYSAYGHTEQMALAVAEGARGAGADVAVKRVPETVPDAVARGARFKLDQAAPIASVAELEHYDAIVVGTGTRFGRMSSQMAAFLDQAGGLWMRDALVGKVGAASAARPPSMVVRRRRCSRSSPTCCISAWSSSACPTAIGAR